MDRLLKEKVWLKSGGFLVIEQTEAFTVIDVNTGKNTGKKTPQETFAAVNREAAEEIARQIRLRQLSGTILVDFINTQKKEEQKDLMILMQALLDKDPVKSRAVDFTALDIMEITRKKEYMSLREQVEAISE